MYITRIFFSSFIAYILSGCTTLAPRVPTAHYESNQSPKNTAEMLYAQAQKCWSHKVTPISYGIQIFTQSTSEDLYIVNVHRIFWPEGIRREPFIEMRISGNQIASTVDVLEGEIGCTLVSGCYKLGLTQHIKHWLFGKNQCFEFDKTLVHM